MSTSISGRGKSRKHGQDLNTNSMPMGGAQQMAPPNGVAPTAAFATPIVPINQPTHHTDYAPRGAPAGAPYVNVEYLQQPPVSGSQYIPSMVLPTGMNIQPEQTSQFANMQGMPQNVRPGMQQWQQQQMPQQHQQQAQPYPQMQGGMGGQAHMNRGGVAPQQGRQYPQQNQAQMGFYQPAVMQPGTGYYMTAPNMYAPQQPQYTPEQYAYAQQQYAYAQQQQQQSAQMMQPQQQQHQAPQSMQQQPQQAPPALQQQGGEGVGGIGGGAAAGQQFQPTHVPASGAAPTHPGAGLPRIPNFTPPQQPRPQPAPLPAKKRNVLAIVDPTTNKTVNETEVEASKREEDAPKAEKDEAKGTDETDSAAPEVKKQFAAQILEAQTTKSEQPAPAPTPASAPAPAPAKNKCLISFDTIKEWGLEDRVTHVPTPPSAVPVAPAAPAAPAPVAPAAAPAAPAAEAVVEEKQQSKQATPEVAVPEEMPAATNNEEEQQQSDDSLLAEPAQHEEQLPASSSSDKNASNDSAICVQTPPPAATVVAVEEEEAKEEEEPAAEAAAAAAAADEPAAAVEEAEEEKEAEQPATPAEEPLVKKLEQLVIEESASQEEAESEPSTPAPVTPSASETAATLAEEEEDAEKAAAAAEEALQQKRADLEAEIAKNEEDPEQVNESLCRYNREYLYNVRDLEKLFHVTQCPLTPDELKLLGICRSLVSNEPKRKQDGQGGFMPGWARSGGGGGRGGGGDRVPYKGRQSEQHGGPRRGGGGHGSNKKLPPSIRPSIERRVDTNVQLHKAEKAWKPEKVTEVDAADDEAKKKLLLKTIRSLFNKITPTTKDALINEFLDHKVYESPALNDVISIIFDKAVEEPKFCPLYSSMCNTQVGEELKLNNNVSHFRNAILVRAQETFTTKNLDEFVTEKQAEIDAETDEKKKREKQIELLEAQSKFRRRKFGNITFIGQLYLQGLISVRIIHFCVFDLLKSVLPAAADAGEPDEESIDCAVRLLETIGKRLQSEANAAVAAAKEAAQKPKVIARGQPAAPAKPGPQQQQPFPIEMTFQTLEAATAKVSSRIKFMIMNLVELRRNGWIPRKGQDAGPKKLDEIKKDIQKEQMENAHQQQQYERKQSRQEPMGGRGMGGGHGGHGGGGGGYGGANPKRQIIQRNSSDRGTLDDRRSQAHKVSNLAPKSAPPKKASLSTVTAAAEKSLGGGSKKWSTGASGGSENSKKEDRAAAIQQASRLNQQRSSSAASMKEEEGASASGTATQVNSEDEREQNELREKQEAEITKRVICEVGDYGTGEITLDEAREGVFKIVGAEKYGKPSLQSVFKCFLAAAIKKVTTTPDMGPKFGHVLAYCLLAKKAEEKDNKKKSDKKSPEEAEILKGIADCSRDIVEQEQWEDAPKIWDIFAEVLINAHMPTDGLYEGAHPTLTDFKDTFLAAAKDTRKSYTLFVLVLKRLAEMHHKRDEMMYMEMVSWVLPECPEIVKHMDENKLNQALKDTKTAFDKDLHTIFQQEH